MNNPDSIQPGMRSQGTERGGTWGRRRVQTGVVSRTRYSGSMKSGGWVTTG